MSKSKATANILAEVLVETSNTDEFLALKTQIAQRIILLLVLINENARSSDLDAWKIQRWRHSRIFKHFRICSTQKWINNLI